MLGVRGPAVHSYIVRKSAGAARRNAEGGRKQPVIRGECSAIVRPRYYAVRSRLSIGRVQTPVFRVAVTVNDRCINGIAIEVFGPKHGRIRHGRQTRGDFRRLYIFFAIELNLLVRHSVHADVFDSLGYCRHGQDGKHHQRRKEYGQAFSQ